jgi:CheY-like chemotaxis protein
MTWPATLYSDLQPAPANPGACIEIRLSAETPMSVRLLLADAEPGLTEIYRRALAGNGFEVATAHTSLDCLVRLRTFRPDVLVLDPELPWGQGQGCSLACARSRTCCCP